MPSESPLRLLHERAGATLGTWFDCLLPDRFADPALECRLAHDAVALLDTSFQAFAFFTGPDRLRYLNALLTCNVKDLADGQGTLGLLLNPQGHILAELRVLALADRLLVAFHAAVRQRTLETLEKFIIMDDVTLEDASDRLGSLALEGPAAGRLLSSLCGLKLEALPEHSHAEVTLAGAPCRVVRASRFGELGAELLAERAHLPALWRALLDAARAHGGGPVGYAALNALRLEAGFPWFGYDFDDKMIPHEAGLETSHINYTKGCYTGQEIVERVRSRGHVNRKRVGLQCLGLEIPPKGAKLLAEGKEVGYVSSAALTPRLGRVLGIGYVRIEHTEPGTLLQWSASEAPQGTVQGEAEVT